MYMQLQVEYSTLSCWAVDFSLMQLERDFLACESLYVLHGNQVTSTSSKNREFLA